MRRPAAPYPPALTGRHPVRRGQPGSTKPVVRESYIIDVRLLPRRRAAARCDQGRRMAARRCGRAPERILPMQLPLHAGLPGVVALAIWLAPAAGSAQQAVRTVTLEEAIRLALERDPAAVTAEEAITRARAGQ